MKTQNQECIIEKRYCLYVTYEENGSIKSSYGYWTDLEQCKSEAKRLSIEEPEADIVILDRANDNESIEF